MKTTKPLLDVQQTVAVLVRALGNPCAWAAWLADIRRTPRPGKTPPSLYGHQLYPYAAGDKKAPLYLGTDVQRFIAEVLAQDPGMGTASKPALYDFDDQHLLPWRYRHACRAASPTAHPAPPAHAARAA